jgi:hypothetical protein
MCSKLLWLVHGVGTTPNYKLQMICLPFQKLHVALGNVSQAMFGPQLARVGS